MDDAAKVALWGGFGLLALLAAVFSGSMGPVAILQILAGVAALVVAALTARQADLV